MANRNNQRTARAYIGGDVRRTVLPGGLRVLSEDMADSHSFSLGFFVGTGSRHESPTLHGASHFLEHVLFKGTKRRGPEEISRAIEEVGGDLNAYTAKEHTCFYAKVLDLDAPVAVDVLSDMVVESLIRPADVDAEREVILDEIAMHADDPSEVAQELVSQRLLANSPLGRSVIGSVESIKALSRDQIVRYWRRRYRPATMTVAAAGRVDHDVLVESLAGLDAAPRFAKGSAAERAAASKPADAGPTVLVRTRPLDHATAVLGFATPGLFDERRYALNLLAVIVGGGMSSRLFVDVREHRGLTYAIEANEGAYSDAGMFTVEWGGAPERMPEILGRVRDCLADVLDNGVTEEELRRAKGQMRGQMVLGYEGPTARMSRLGTAELLHDPRSVSEILAAYERVNRDDILSVARDFLGAHPVLAVVGHSVNRGKLERLTRGFAR